LKQFLIKMLCAGRNIPILGGCEDGNTSDKTINNTLLAIGKNVFVSRLPFSYNETPPTDVKLKSPRPSCSNFLTRKPSPNSSAAKTQIKPPYCCVNPALICITPRHW